MELITLYQVLGVEETATAEEINKAYRQMARKHHTDLPDSTSGDKVLMVALNKARDVLLNPDSRREYDKQLKEARNPRPSPPPSPPHPPRAPTVVPRATAPAKPSAGLGEAAVVALAAWGTFEILKALFGGNRRT